MIAEELINHMIPPLKVTDDAHKAIVWMEEFRCNYLPVVDNGELKGFISEEIILESNDIEHDLSKFELVGKDCTVTLDSHFYDILKTAAHHKLQMVCVVDENRKYAGVITVQDIMSSFAQTAAVQMPQSANRKLAWESTTTRMRLTSRQQFRTRLKRFEMGRRR